MQIGYCTNVHAGADWPRTRANLERYALAVKRLTSPDRPMGIGLWLSAAAVQRLLDGELLDEFGGWLRDVGLVPFTFNGFPYGDFHEPVVKHRVYQPTWLDARRGDYTLTLASVQHRLLPPAMEGSISTLPVAWGDPPLTQQQWKLAAEHTRRVAAGLAQLESDTGRLVYLAIEPEPGCVIQRSADLVRFFEDHLLPGGDERVLRRHIRVCHDVCHAAVMFESQADALRNYRNAGILLGKVQVSSAVRARFATREDEQRQAVLDQLAGFAEDRYLHQTMVRFSGQGEDRFYEDLTEALDSTSKAPEPWDEWRVHFHVPIYLQAFGELEGTQSEIVECLQTLPHHPELKHLEAETYAWGVLPPEIQQPDLAVGIARELGWLEAATKGL